MVRREPTGRTSITKAEAIYQRLKSEIISGRRLPGQRLVTTQISREYDVSETPVREALRRLEAEGLVRVQPHAGARVDQPDFDKMNELALIRIELECLATRLAVSCATPSLCDKLDVLLSRMEDALGNGDGLAYGDLNRRFHETIYRATGYEELVALIDNLWGRTEHKDSIFALTPEAMARSHQQHIEIVAALRRKDAATAERVAREQKEAAVALYRKLWQKAQPVKRRA